MIILSLYGACGWEPDDGCVHSSRASLWVDNVHVCTISEERLTRIKYDGSYPQKSIDYCLEVGNITVDKIDTIVYVENIHSLNRKPLIEKNWSPIFLSEVFGLPRRFSPELRCLPQVNNYIREISIAKVRILGHPFGAIFDAFLSHFRVANFHPQKCQFIIGIWHPKLVPKTVPKCLQNRDPEIPI